MDRKFAALSMDVEDWYHLDCLQSCNPDTSKSMLDGFVNYAEMLNRHGIKATFFVLGELAQQARETLLYLDDGSGSSPWRYSVTADHYVSSDDFRSVTEAEATAVMDKYTYEPLPFTPFVT